MRIAARLAFGAIVFSGAHFAAVRHARAQDAQVLMPDQSAAKAKQLVQQAIDALGGSAYLDVHDVTNNEQVSQFDHGGGLLGYMQVNDFRALPDKARIEFIAKGHHNILQYVVGIEGLDFSHGGVVIALYNGNHGWSYDRSGVNELPADSVAEFQETEKESVGNILRHRIQEPGMVMRYGGMDIVELKEVDWVELADSDDRTIRIAIARSTHLPIQKITETRDPDARTTTEEIEDYSDYQLIQGIQTPFQITRWRNQMKVYQAFFMSCEYNTGLDGSLFTEQSLKDRWDQTDGKHKK
jgi:hypothetical protein